MASRDVSRSRYPTMHLLPSESGDEYEVSEVFLTVFWIDMVPWKSQTWRSFPVGFPGNGEVGNVEVCSIVEVYMGVPQAGTPGKNHGRRWQVASCQSAFYPFSPILVAYTRTHMPAASLWSSSGLAMQKPAVPGWWRWNLPCEFGCWSRHSTWFQYGFWSICRVSLGWRWWTQDAGQDRVD